MSKNRQSRINEEIRDILSQLLRFLKDPRISGLVSIVRCETTGDMRYCKVFVSVYGSEEQKTNAVKGLKSAAGWLRRELAKQIEIRYTPELIFAADDSINHGAEISKILHSLNIKDGDSDDGQINS